MVLAQLTKMIVGWSTPMLTLSSPQTRTTKRKEEFTVFGMDSDDDTEAPPPTATKRKISLIHLPDHLFTPVFAAKAKAVVAPGDEEGEARGKRRKKTGASAKDVLGSRILRTLPTTTEPRPNQPSNPKRTRNSSSVCSLSNVHPNLKGRGGSAELIRSSSVLLWRKVYCEGKLMVLNVANVGVMRGMDPAAHFVRGA
ncbi:hypothetical protein BDQ17DRAFT_229833 [Cyathus striatus]|nr:hypothetical protein BDQ17DRAFT_229833 [Cyathus striatus]